MVGVAPRDNTHRPPLAMTQLDKVTTVALKSIAKIGSCSWHSPLEWRPAPYDCNEDPRIPLSRFEGSGPRRSGECTSESILETSFFRDKDRRSASSGNRASYRRRLVTMATRTHSEAGYDRRFYDGACRRGGGGAEYPLTADIMTSFANVFLPNQRELFTRVGIGGI